MSELMAVFPLSQAFLPGEWVALRVFEDRYLRMLSDIRSDALELCTVLIERGSEVGGGDVRLSHGVVLEIVDVSHDDTGVHLGCRAGRIVSIGKWIDDREYPTAMTTDQTVESLDARTVAVAAGNLGLTISKCRGVIESMGLPMDAHDQATAVCDRVLDDLGHLDSVPSPEAALWRSLWLAARLLPCGALDRYALLAPGSLAERAARLDSIVDHVGEVLRFGNLP